jgi:hypothetical protein
MARYRGVVGFVTSEETAPDFYSSDCNKRTYIGDVFRNTRRLENPGQINDNVVVNNLISIVADDYALNHFFEIRYATWRGVKWKVSNVEVQRPRLILTLGEVYNDGNEN